MNDKELIVWLRENSSGIYRPAAEAADRLEMLNPDRLIKKMERLKIGENEIDCGMEAGVRKCIAIVERIR